jgi:hypothetical protein
MAFPRARIPAFVHSCICAFLVVLTAPLHAEVIDRVLAVVGGSLITLTDVNAAYDLGLVVPPASPDRVRAVLSSLIDRELQLAEVDRYAPPDPAPADIEQEVQAVRSRFPSRAAFDEVLVRSGLDLSDLRDMLRENLQIRAYLDQRFAASGERRQQAMDEWIAGLRRRADIVDLYLIGGGG